MHQHCGEFFELYHEQKCTKKYTHGIYYVQIKKVQNEGLLKVPFSPKILQQFSAQKGVIQKLRRQDGVGRW